MSILASFDRFVVLPQSSSPDGDSNFGSISASLQISNTIFVVRQIANSRSEGTHFVSSETQEHLFSILKPG